MAWITLPIDYVKHRLTDQEMGAVKAAVSVDGTRDPLPGIVIQIVLEVRGYISASGRKLNAGITLPQTLVNAAISRIRYELANTIPSGVLMTKDRIRENEDALALLKSVKTKDFVPESATDPSDEKVQYTLPSTACKELGFDASSQNGL